MRPHLDPADPFIVPVWSALKCVCYNWKNALSMYKNAKIIKTTLRRVKTSSQRLLKYFCYFLNWLTKTKKTLLRAEYWVDCLFLFPLVLGIRLD